MILTDYYKAEKLTDAKSRFDVTASTKNYDLFESLFINKQKFNVGGLSFNCVPRPGSWGGKALDLALTKGNVNVTSIKRPDPKSIAGFGDIAGTQDACIIIFNGDFKQVGIQTIEILIGRGLKNDCNSLWDLYSEMELDTEIQTLREMAVTFSVTPDPNPKLL